MTAYKGLLYVKHGAVGTRSEGPIYLLQTHAGDLLLSYERDRDPWEPDYHLEFYLRRMIEVLGKEIGRGHILVEHIKELGVSQIPE